MTGTRPDMRSVAIIALFALSLVLFSINPRIAGLLLFLTAAAAIGPTKPKSITLFVMSFLWVNDIVADFYPLSQYTAWKDVLLLMVLVGWLIRSTALRRGLLLKSPITAPLVLVISFFVISCAASPSLVNAILGLKATIYYMMWVFVLPDVVKNREDALHLFWAIMFGTLCLGIYNLYRIQLPYGYLPPRRDGTVVAGFMAAHWSGSVFTLAFGVIMGVAMMPEFRSRARLLLNVILLVGGIGLMATTVRATYGATALSLIATGFVARRYDHLLKALAVGVLAGFILQMNPEVRVGERIASSLDSGDASLQQREAETRERSLPYVLSHPLGGGTGVMTAGASAAAWAGDDVTLALKGGIVHNNFILVAIEIGWLGLLAWVWLVVTMIIAPYRIFRESQDSMVRNMALGVFGVAIYYLAMHPFQRVLSAAQAPVMFWVIMGLIPLLPLLEEQARVREALPKDMTSVWDQTVSGHTR